MIDKDDRGLLLGDGLFETMTAQNGQIRHFDAHFDRLSLACRALYLPTPNYDECFHACTHAYQSLNASEAIIRLTYTAGTSGRGLDRSPHIVPTLFAKAFVKSPPPKSLKLGLSPIRRNETAPSSRHKTLGYIDPIIARHQAKAQGYDDALLLNGRHEIACLTAANLFWFEGERLMTPSLECGVLNGIMRAFVLKAAKAIGIDYVETKTRFDPNAPYDGAFASNSVMGLVVIDAIDDKEIAPIETVKALRSYLLV